MSPGYRYKGTEFDAAEPLKPAALAELPTYNQAKCGTTAGYHQHIRYGTETCDPCREANNEYKRSQYETRAPRKAWTPDRCGTLSGWSAHNRYGVPVCGPCRAAQAAYQTEYRAGKRRSAPKLNQ
jgi:hypothetical protein